MKPPSETLKNCDRRLRQAFSLIEVTMALGIVSVAFIALLGLLPIGLNTFTRSIDASVKIRIAQSIIAQARQAKFTELPMFASSGRFDFDEQGNPVKNAKDRIYFSDPTGGGGDGPDIKIVYKENLRVGEAGGTGGIQAAEANVAVIAVTVRKVSSPKEKSTVVGYIANNGL